MQKWEYKIVSFMENNFHDTLVSFGQFHSTRNPAATALEVLGDEGWELVSVLESPGIFRCFFKRPKA